MLKDKLPLNLKIDKKKKRWLKNIRNLRMGKVKSQSVLPSSLSCQRFLSETESSEFYINIRLIFQFLLILPLSISECEREFSQMNLIKTDIRHRISVNVFADLLMIKLNVPLLMNFNPGKAIKL